MQLHCTRPNCPAPLNNFSDLDSPQVPRPLKQKYCSACRMELILGGRYLPTSILGKGGFGTAFLASDFDSPTKRKCVVKLFQPPGNLTSVQMATAQRLFATEAEVLERFGLQHRQIPNLYAYFPILVTNPLTHQTEELFYLVQEFIDGEDLDKILERDGQFPESEVEEVLRVMLNVLDFVHSNSAIHRDVKPSNIMKGRNGQLYLLDFGAVKEVTAPTGVQRGPTTICSPDYAPPEQIMNGTVNVTSDLYALAATCVVLLTNRGSNELRDSSTNTWQWERYARVSPQLAQVLNKMLDARPSDRYPSAQDVLSALSSSSRPARKPRPASAPAVPAVPAVPAASPQTAPPLSPPLPVQTAQPAAPPLSLVQFISSAAFVGVEGGLLGIAAFSLISTRLIGGTAWLAMLAVLLILQLRRVIEGWDFLIIVGLTLAAVVMFVPGDVVMKLVIAVMAGGAAVAIAILFRLIFRLMSRIL